MDMADAVNIMTFASKDQGRVGLAAWDIYPSNDSAIIRKFLREECDYQDTVDPIHSQNIYLTTDLRRKLHEMYGVKGWRIYQQPGEAIFIPAGCCHQVRT